MTIVQIISHNNGSQKSRSDRMQQLCTLADHRCMKVRIDVPLAHDRKSNVAIRVRTLVLGYWVLPNIFQYWVLDNTVIGCHTQYQYCLDTLIPVASR